METNENVQENTESQESPPETKSVEVKSEEQLQAELEESKSKYLYLYAEFETFKKRAIKERSDLIKFGNENLVREILSVLDNLERALEHAQDPSAVAEGIRMVNQQFKEILNRFGVKTIEAVGKKFDPEMHEAISQEESEDVPSGNVLKVHQQGYTIHGRLLRPVKVVVAVELKKS